jgi:hypothetical protein
MKTIAITTQAELDALPARFEEYTIIAIRSTQRISITKARGNSSVVAWENSSVVAWENLSVEARENSSVEAWGNSSVVARENSSVEANDFSMIAVLVSTVVIKKLLDYAIGSFRGFTPKVEEKAATATVVETPAIIERKPEYFWNLCESDGNGSVYLYKSVDPKTLCDFQTGKIKYEGVVECPDFDPSTDRECGGGLHLSPTKGQARSYHMGKVLKCRVKKEDIVIYAPNMTKVRCRKVEVLK